MPSHLDGVSLVPILEQSDICLKRPYMDAIIREIR